MPRCHCKFKGCNGKNIPKSMRRYHLECDREREQQEPLAQGLGEASTSSAPPVSSAPAPSIRSDAPPVTPPVHASSHTGNSDSGMSMSSAEECGRLYMEAMAAANPASIDSSDEIGDLFKDEGALFDESHEPPPAPASTLSATPSRITSSHRRSTIISDPATITPISTPTPVYLLYLLVSWLHTACKLAFPACAAVLIVIGQILGSSGVALENRPYKTLASVMSNLGIEPTFQILPVCPSCLEVYPASRAGDSTCDRCDTPLFRRIKRLDRRRPHAEDTLRPFLQFPTKGIEAQLHEILAVPGMEDILEGWRSKTHSPGEYQDNFDGRICHEVKGPDDRIFFENPLLPGCDELRIGLTLGVDWFSYLRSHIAPSHSSCLMSFNVINLPHHLRYRTANLILAGIMPGPKEQDSDEVQRFMWIFVNELLRLWKDGFLVKTRKFPQGRLARVILVCVICDKPAAHKLGGFRAHSHTFFCTRCWIKQSEKATAASFERNGFQSCSHAEQMRLAKEYAQSATQSARDEFAQQNATRWCELARLPYFDVCHMIVVDPMHNLLLGLVKTHFYHIWIQLKVLRKTKELRRFHDILSKLQIPAYLGRLPSLMGQPAGGSLTADKWLIAATVVCPIALPQIWDEYCTGDAETICLRRLGDLKAAQEKKKEAEAAAHKARAAAKAAAATETSRRSGRKCTCTEKAVWVDNLPPGEAEIPDAGAQETDDIFGNSDDEGNEPIYPNLHPDDPSNFFKLSSFLKIVLSPTITDQAIDEAEHLIRAYCRELVHLYGPDIIRPNHHYATDVPDCMRDFGPLHGFWMFLFERLNKILKSYNSSNHAGGQLEVSFFREFHRTVQQSRVMATAYSTRNFHIQASIDAMYKATADDRGTVQALAWEIEEQNVDGAFSSHLLVFRNSHDLHTIGGVMYGISDHAVELYMQADLYQQVLQYLQLRMFHVRSHMVLGPGVPLLPKMTMFDYVVISQRRYWASTRNNNLANSLVAVATGPGQFVVGKLTRLFAISQPHVSPANIYLGEICWLVPVINAYPADSAWKGTEVLHVSVWEQDAYVDGTALIRVDDIISHVVVTEAIVAGVTRWVSIMLHRNGREF
ncbi:hypothetical protein EVG20_g747 [Dentipellis fragilis]|uniref:Uncharacterized protein n=1 Tax=Dentipellis fragilis TaxID=205917 RepID=A0A4Y9ZCQ4_9AGAM|nr:hypothetical protein EVG20_g747 [Dentipellis fragilis]